MGLFKRFVEPFDDNCDDETECYEHSVDSPADLNCFYVDEDCEDGPRFFTPNGREVDKDGFPISSTDHAFQEHLLKKANQRKHLF